MTRHPRASTLALLELLLPIIYFAFPLIANTFFDIQTRFQKSWDTVQIVNKKGMQ